MKTVTLLISLFIQTTNMFALFSVNGFDARLNGMAGAPISENYSYFNNNINAGIVKNPALITVAIIPVIRMNYSQLFSLPGLDFTSLDLLYPFKQGGVGLHISTLGDTLYRESKVAFGIGYEILPQFHIGLLLNLQNLYITGLENSSTIGINIGVNGSLSKKFSFGATIINCNKPTLSNHLNNSIPTIIGVGINYMITEKWGSYLSLEKHSTSMLRLNFGTEQNIFSFLYLRGGFHTMPNLLSFGVGLKLDSWKIDWSLQYPINKLGLTQTWSLSHNFGSTKPKQFQLRQHKLINLNQANSSALETLPSISAQMAATVILFRKTKHRFFHISQLTKIRGINYNLYSKIKNRISVHSSGKKYFPLKGETANGLHINQAEMRELIIAGLSPNKARKLIVLRNTKGGFYNIKELMTTWFLTKIDRAKIRKAILAK